MDSDMLEWLSFNELESLSSDNLITELETKLLQTEKDNITQLVVNQEKSQALAQQIREADKQLEELQSTLETYLAKVQETRKQTEPLEEQNTMLAIQQQNTRGLIEYLSKKLSGYGVLESWNKPLPL